MTIFWPIRWQEKPDRGGEGQNFKKKDRERNKRMEVPFSTGCCMSDMMQETWWPQSHPENASAERYEEPKTG